MNTAAIIYSHSITTRLQYIVDFLAKYYGVAFKLTSNEETYVVSSSSCKINYSYHKIADEEIWMHPHVLLFESAAHPVKIECFQHQSTFESKEPYTCFFKAEGDLHFDLFAAIFYLITRYEEYLPHQKDIYGRYAHENAIAFKENFLQLPLVNIWLEDFRNLLAKNNAVATEYTAISNARIARDKGLYSDKTGLVPIALEVKDYIKSVFGATSPEYKQVSGIKFKLQKA